MPAIMTRPLKMNCAKKGATTLLMLLAGTLAQAESIKIGGLLSLTGNWSSLGKASQVMMEFARDDLNVYFKDHQSTARIKLQIEDTALQPDLAIDRYHALVRAGAISMVGPQSSSEVGALIDSVARLRVPIISQGSTASSLGKPGDGIYRIVPNDIHEAEALLALLKARGIKTLIPLWRDDLGNNGLHDSLKTQFTASGGQMLNGIRYSNNDQQDFTPIVAEVNRQLLEALASPGATTKNVAIYAASFDEITSIMKVAAKTSSLRSIRWYGSDGVANSQVLLSDSSAAQFAIDTDYPNPNFGLSAAAKVRSDALSKRYLERTGEVPDAFAIAAYDATFVAGLNASYRKRAVIKSDQDLLGETSNLFFGGTGWTALDATGDRRSGDYDFWAIKTNPTSLKPFWTIVCHFDSTLNSLTGPSCAP